MLPYYFVLAQCFHKFRLGAEPSPVFFQGLYFPCSFSQILPLSSFLSFCRGPASLALSASSAGLACGSGGCAALFTEEHVHPWNIFHTPWAKRFYVFGPEQPFGFFDEEPLKIMQRLLSHILQAVLYIIAIVITSRHSLRVMCTSVELN